MLLFDVYRSDFPTTSLGSNHNIQTLITSYGINNVIKFMINLIVNHPMTVFKIMNSFNLQYETKFLEMQLLDFSSHKI